MKTLLCALVFFFPLATFAQGKEDIPSEEKLRILQNCCTQAEPRREPSMFGELKQKHWTRHLVEKSKRLQLYAIDPGKPEAGRLSFERHQKIYGFWYRQESGILDGSP